MMDTISPSFLRTSREDFLISRVYRKITRKRTGATDNAISVKRQLI